MDNLALAIQNLKTAEMLFHNRPPNRDDLFRLQGIIKFLDRILAAHSYYASGDTEGLEESSFDEYRYASRTLEALHQASSFPEIKRYLLTVRRDLAKLQSNRVLSNAKRRDGLRAFLEAVGRAILSEDLSATPILEGIEEEGPEEYRQSARG